MKRVQALLLAAAVIGAVAGARVLLRDEGPGPPAATDETAQAEPTGRRLPLELAPLPPTMERQGDFVCAELKNPNGTYTARAEGGSVRNAAETPLTYDFTFQVFAKDTSETVESRFRLDAGKRVPSVTMASKSLVAPVTKCALRFAAAEVTPQDIARVEVAAQAAGCGRPVRHESEGHDHISPPERGTYRTSPPTSGNHYPQPATTGVHERPIQNETQVHNLEHGHVGLQYRNASSRARAILENVAEANDGWAFAAPYPSMGAAVALTAWTVSLECATEPRDLAAFNELARVFVSVFRDRGRESIPGA